MQQERTAALQPRADTDETSESDLRPRELSPKTVMLVFVGLLLAMTAGTLQQTIVATALLTIVGELDGMDHVMWVTTAYVLAATAAMPVYGKVGDLLGRKWLLVGALIVFTIGSVVCGCAFDMRMLIIGRFVQGLGGGGVIVLTQAIVADVIPARKRALYLNIMGIAWAAPMLVGPLLGGLFTDHLTWRLSFFVTVPLAAVAIAATAFLLPSFARQGRLSSFDVAGTVTIAAAVCTLTLATSFGGNEFAWSSPQIVGLLAATVLFGALFVVAEHHAKEPIMPLMLFRNRNFVLATIAGFIVLFGFMAILSYLPMYFQIAHGMSATAAGYMELPMNVLYFVASLAVGALIARSGKYKAMMVASFVVSTIAGVGLALLNPTTPPLAVAFLYLGLMGLGFGMCFEVLVLIVQNEFPAAIVGTATSATNFFREIGTTLGASVAGAVFTGNLSSLMIDRLAPLGGAEEVGIDPNALTPAVVGALPTDVHAAIASAYNDALMPVFALMVPLLVAGIVAMALLKPTPLSETLER